MTAPSDPAPAPVAERATLLDDLIEIWYAPAKVFARRNKGEFFLLMVILTVVIGALFYAGRGALEGVIRAQMAEAMRQNPNVTAEQMAAGRKVGEFISIFGGFIGVPIGILLVGLGVWLTAKLMGAEEFSYGQGASIAAFSYVPRVLGGVILAAQGLLLDTRTITSPGQLSIGVARFVPADLPGGLMQLLLRLDVFTIWASVLIGIGISVIGKVPRSKILPAAVVIWCFGALPALWTMLMEALRGGT